MERQSSFISKLPVITATLEKLKVELAAKKLQVLEARRVGGSGDVKELEKEWGFLESEIDLLEHTAKVMTDSLMADGMKLAGVTPEMVLLTGKV